MGVRIGCRHWAVAACVIGALGCDAFGTPPPDGPVRVVPTDARPVQQSLLNLPSISGGTLTLSADGALAVVGDPERGRITIIDVNAERVAHAVALRDGDEPGRIAFDGRGVAHVLLRGAGELMSLDAASGRTLQRTAVCGAPRGVAYDENADAMVVACAAGELVALDPATGTERWRRHLDADLRDVAVESEGLHVTRFKSAETLHLDHEGRQLSKSRLVDVEHTVSETRRFQPAIAWRTVSDGAGGTITVHQRAQRDEVVIDAKPDPVTGDSSYGGGGEAFRPSCEGIVHTAVTFKNATGQTSSTAPLANVVMAVDVAVSRDWIALAVAGSADPDAPRPFVVQPESDFGFDRGGVFFGPSVEATGAVLVPRSSLENGNDPFRSFGCEFPQPAVPTGRITPFGNAEQVTSVAFTSDGTLVYQVREPAAVVIVRAHQLGTGEGVRIELGGESVADTGHDLFHRDSGDGIACASCHAEGGDDGHTWVFNTIGTRRTQAVNVGIEGTEPFHWDGDMRGLHHIMDAVFVGRMGGARQSDDRVQALSTWVFEQHLPTPIRSVNDPAAQRGHDLFFAPSVGCNGCHSGDKFTDNSTIAVGTGQAGERFQVPSLVGIGYRAPFMHNGCAATLRERFTNPDCAGGDRHGVTSQLNDSQIDDLVAFMETL